MKKSILILLLTATIIGSCGPSKKMANASFENISSFNNVPQYFPLNVPMGELTLPAVLVGNEELPSSGCFKTDAVLKPTSGLDHLIQQAERQKNIEASLKAKLEKEFTNAGLENEFKSFMSSTVTSKIYGSNVYLVDPALSGPNFENGTCRVKDLKWYDDNRRIISGAIKADSVIIEFTDTLSNELKSKFDLVVKKLNGDLKATFNRAVKENGEISLKGTNIFYAGLTTSIKSSTCSFKFESKLIENQIKSFELCNNKILIKKSEGFDRISVNFINVSDGIQSGYYDVIIGELTSVPFGENRYASILVTPESREYQLDTSITLVGLTSN